MKTKQRNWVYNILAIFMVMLLVAVAVHAEENDTDNETVKVRGDALQVRFDHLTCKVDFTKTQIELIQKYVTTEGNLSTVSDKLTNDMTQLADYKTSANKSLFDSYVTDTISKDIQDANAQIKSIKDQLKTYNLTNTSKEAFKTDLKTAVATYSSCVSDREEKMAKVLERHYSNVEKQWSKVLDRMEKRKINITDVNDTYNKLLDQLQQLKAAIESGNETRIREALKDLQQKNLHLWANFEKGRLSGYLDKIETMSNNSNHTGNIKEMRKNLKDIEQYSKEGYKFKPGDADKVWKELKDTSKGLADTSKDILKERMKERQDNRGQGRPDNKGPQGNQRGGE